MAFKNPALAAVTREPNTGLTTGEKPVTIDDVTMRTGMLFLVFLPFAWVGYQFLPGNLLVVLLGSLVALGLVIAVMRATTLLPPLAFLYSAVEGLLVGAISAWYATAYADGGVNIIWQAVTATLVVFAVMLIGYKTGLVKVTSKSRRFFTLALWSYLAIGIMSLVAALFGVGGGWGFYGLGAFGILISVLAVGLASYSLAVDFDDVQLAIRHQLPEREAWRLGVGLLVSLVWLYLELLRTIGLTRST